MLLAIIDCCGGGQLTQVEVFSVSLGLEKVEGGREREGVDSASWELKLICTKL